MPERQKLDLNCIQRRNFCQFMFFRKKRLGKQTEMKINKTKDIEYNFKSGYIYRQFSLLIWT